MRIAVIGASGGIGRAMCEKLEAEQAVTRIYALSRSGNAPASAMSKAIAMRLDLRDEQTIIAAADKIKLDGDLTGVIVASGLLSDAATGLAPEKSLREQTLPAFEDVFAINTFGPAIVAKHFLPLLARKQRAVFAALSARVGSISDNRLGGWHAYRASKAALNMLVKNYALEMKRRNEESIVVSLHPGTVATDLSAPFTGSGGRTVFSPAQSADYLWQVISALTPADTGKAFDWQGTEIPA